MKTEQQQETIIFTQENESNTDFITAITQKYTEFKNYNLIVKLSNVVEILDVALFTTLAEKQKKAKKTFVIVTNAINFTDVPESLLVVPTLIEAHDIIQMEEIERDLDI